MARKPRSRKEMIAYLSNHFRYDTMSSNNRATSFAAKIKLHHIEFPDEETRDRAWDLLDVEEAFDDFRDVLADFDERHNYSYQIGTNGRSGGYLVLYSGGKEDTGYKSYCPKCGQRNYKVAVEGNNLCGVCKHPRTNYTRPIMRAYTYGKTVGDYYGNYEDWETRSLKELVDVVWDFDKTVKAAVQAFIDYARHNEAAEETVMVPKKIKVSRPVGGAE
jgi:ribosomal protein L37E